MRILGGVPLNIGDPACWRPSGVRLRGGWGCRARLHARPRRSAQDDTKAIRGVSATIYIRLR